MYRIWSPLKSASGTVIVVVFVAVLLAPSTTSPSTPACTGVAVTFARPPAASAAYAASMPRRRTDVPGVLAGPLCSGPPSMFILSCSCAADRRGRAGAHPLQLIQE